MNEKVKRDHIHIEFAQGHGEFDPLSGTLAHAQYPAAAEPYSRAFHRACRTHTIFEGMRCDHFFEKRPGGFQVVVKTDHPPRFQIAQLLFLQTSQRTMGLDTGLSGDRLQGIADLFEFAIIRDSLSADDDPQPRCAKPCGLCCRLEDFFCSNIGINRGFRIVEGRLRAECAIFGAAAGFGVDNRAAGDSVATEMRADSICRMDQKQKMFRGKRRNELRLGNGHQMALDDSLAQVE